MILLLVDVEDYIPDRNTGELWSILRKLESYTMLLREKNDYRATFKLSDSANQVVGKSL